MKSTHLLRRLTSLTICRMIEMCQRLSDLLWTFLSAMHIFTFEECEFLLLLLFVMLFPSNFGFSCCFEVNFTPCVRTRFGSCFPIFGPIDIALNIRVGQFWAGYNLLSLLLWFVANINTCSFFKEQKPAKQGHRVQIGSNWHSISHFRPAAR